MTTPTAALNPPGALYEQAAQFRSDLGAMQQAAVDQVVAAHAEVYAQVRAEFDAVLDKIAEATENGQVISPAWLYQRTRLKNALATTKTELGRYAEYASDQTRAAHWAAIQAGVKHASKMGQTAVNQVGVSAGFLDVDPAVLEHLVGFLADGTPLDALFATLVPEVSESLRRSLVQGVTLGKGVDWMTRRVEQSLNMPRHRAETIIRTESQRAYRAATKTTYEANTEVLAGWTWVATLDARVCPACLVLDGTEYPTYASLDGHPRCRCAMVPRTKTYDELLGLPEGTTPDSRPPVRSGRAWLESQSPGTQRAILGPGKWKAWKAGEITLDDVVARHFDPAWGTMRRERSLREIRDGVHGNYADAPAQPPAPVEYAPQAHVAATMKATFSVEEIEAFLAEGQGGQYKANLKAALAMHLNEGPEQGPALPGPDLEAAAKATAKMNKAAETKGYPSKGYSQTVAVYKARANGTVGTKVGILDPLTWDAKMTAQKALSDHQEWLVGFLEEQEKKAQESAAAKALAMNLWEQVQANFDKALDDSMVKDSLLVQGVAFIIPEGPQRDRFLAKVDALRDAYLQDKANVLDLKVQSDKWVSDTGDTLVINDEGWAVVDFQSNGQTQTLKPHEAFALLMSQEEGWQVPLEPEPDKVKNLVVQFQAYQDPAYLDQVYFDMVKDAMADPNHQWSSQQHKINMAEALAQAEATLLPLPEADQVQENVDLALQGDGSLLDVMIAAFQKAKDEDSYAATPGKTKAQNKSNGLATLKALLDVKADQAKASTHAPGGSDVFDPLNPSHGDLADGLPWNQDWNPPSPSGVQEVLDKVNDPTNSQWTPKTLHDAVQFAIDHDLTTVQSVSDQWAALKALELGAPEVAYGKAKDPSWPAVKPASVANWLADLNDGDETPESLGMKAFGPDSTASPQAQANIWEALKQYQDAQVAPAATKAGTWMAPKAGDSITHPTSGQTYTWNPHWPNPDPDKVQEIVGKFDTEPDAWTPGSVASSLDLDWLEDQTLANYWGALKALEEGVSPPSAPDATPGPQAAPGPPPGPFGAPPLAADLTFTGKVLGTHGAKVYRGPDGTEYLVKPPKDPGDQFLVDVDVAASVLQAKAGLKAPDTWAMEIDGKRVSVQRMFDAKPAFGSGFQSQTLTAEDRLAVQKEQVLDWLLSNHDGHLEQFLRLPSGELVGIDKGQAFRWMGQDRLDWNFHPNGYYGAPPPVYNALWREFAQGGAAEVVDPRHGPLAEFIQSLMDLDDDEVRDLFRPYAEKAAARGLLASPQPSFPGVKVPPGGLPTNDVNGFLDMLVARKNGLDADFTALYERAAKERAKNLPGWKPTKPKATAASKAKARLKALKGTPEPEPPKPPPTPEAQGQDLFTSWLAKAEARYQANPNKAKANLQATANWNRFQRVIEQGDKSAVQELLDRKYLDQAMADEARDLIDQREALLAKAQADYAVAYAEYEREQAAYGKRLEEWRKANGIKVTFAGMDKAVLRHVNDRDGVEWAKKALDVTKITGRARDSIRSYTGSGSANWNPHLRRRGMGAEPTEYETSIKAMDKAMTPIPEDVIMHRGVHMDAFVGANGTRFSRGASNQGLTDLVGTIQDDAGYHSSSVGMSAGFYTYPVQVKIRVPKGTPAAFAMPFSSFDHEREVILKRGLKFYVHAAYPVDNRWVLEVEIVPDDWKPPLDASGKPITSPSAEPWTRLDPTWPN